MPRGTELYPENSVLPHCCGTAILNRMSPTRTELSRAAQLLGSKGGRTTAQRLTLDERRASAQRASAARWSRVRDAEQDELKRVNANNAELWEPRGEMPE
jgi:hypothetical protein